jgi:outer membrane protein
MSRSFARAQLRSRLLLAALLSLSTAALSAQTPPAPPVLAADRPLSLDDAIALALQKNFDLQRQVYTLENAKESVEISRATFDPTLSASISRAVSQSASTTSRLEGTTLQGPRSDNTTISVGANERLAPTNGTFGLATNLTRGATNSANALLNPSFGNGLSASFSQPLLQNAGRKAATANVERAKLSLGIAYLTYKSRVLQLIRDTENFYYNLVAARESLRIRQLTLEYNKTLLDETQARRNSGVATDLDVLSADVQLANARRAVVQAEQAVRDAEDALLNVINVPNFDVRPGAVAFDDYREGVPNFAQSYKLARDFSPDSLSAAEQVKVLEITLDVARRNVLPSLNLDARLGYTARSVSTSYVDVISNLPNDHGNNWSLGLTYSMPWGRRAEKANYRTAKNNLESQKVALDQLEQQLLLSVRSAVRAVESNLTAAEIATQATQLAARQYDQQKARYDAGLSTSRVLLQFQDDLETARFNELTAKLNLRRAVSDLHRLEGTSLQKFRVQLPQ